jgi:hypothetical protein
VPSFRIERPMVGSGRDRAALATHNSLAPSRGQVALAGEALAAAQRWLACVLEEKWLYGNGAGIRARVRLSGPSRIIPAAMACRAAHTPSPGPYVPAQSRSTPTRDGPNANVN